MVFEEGLQGLQDFHFGAYSTGASPVVVVGAWNVRGREAVAFDDRHSEGSLVPRHNAFEVLKNKLHYKTLNHNPIRQKAHTDRIKSKLGVVVSSVLRDWLEIAVVKRLQFFCTL